MPDGYGYEASGREDRGLDQGISPAEQERAKRAGLGEKGRLEEDAKNKVIYAEADERIRKNDADNKEKYRIQQENQKKFCEFISSRGDSNEIKKNVKTCGSDPEYKIGVLKSSIQLNYEDMPMFGKNKWEKTRTEVQAEIKQYQAKIEQIKSSYSELKPVIAAWINESEQKTINSEDEYKENYKLFKRMLESSCESKGGRRKSRKQKSKKYGKTKKSKRSKK